MARIDVLPSIEIIRGLKGILDFYVHRGVPCVRAWPRYRPARQTDASLAAALTFGAIVKAYALLANLVLLAYREDALDQPRTARDIMVTGVYGNLHEASMSDFLDALIIIRDGVVALTDLLHALDSVDTDEIVVNVDQSVLPPLAATTTNQATQITAEQYIAKLPDAMESIALDRVLVRGMDQLHSFGGVLGSTRSAVVSGADGWVNSHPCPAGTIWHVTNVMCVCTNDATTALHLEQHHDAASTNFHYQAKAAPQGIPWIWRGHIWLDPDDFIRAHFIGAAAGKTGSVRLTGEIMTLET